VIGVKTSLISREQRDVARSHGCQEGPLAIVQPLNGTGLPAMTHSLFCGTDYLQSGVRVNGSTNRGSCRTKRDPDTVRRKAKARLATAKPGTTRISRRGWREGETEERQKERGRHESVAGAYFQGWVEPRVVGGEYYGNVPKTNRITTRTPVFRERCLSPWESLTAPSG